MTIGHDWSPEMRDEEAIADKKVISANATGLLRQARLLADLRDCEEVFVSGNPIDQQDAKELRCKVTITGPTRLLAPLMDALTANDKHESSAG